MQNHNLFKADIEGLYRTRLKFATLIALIIVTSVFYSFQRSTGDEAKITVPDLPQITVIDIPQTIQLTKKPRPVRPSIPIADEDDDDYTGDVNVDKVLFNPEVEVTPPPASWDENEEVEFYKLEKKPKLIRQATPVYPELAKKAHIQGTVTVQVLLSKKGRVLEAVILKSVPMLDDAALQAAKKCIFTPGMQRDRYVRVRVSIPFVFKLTN